MLISRPPTARTWFSGGVGRSQSRNSMRPLMLAFRVVDHTREAEDGAGGDAPAAA